MKEQLNELLKQRQQLQDELIKANKSEFRNESQIILALEDNRKLIELLINKPVETTNEQPKVRKCSCIENCSPTSKDVGAICIAMNEIVTKSP